MDWTKQMFRDFYAGRSKELIITSLKGDVEAWDTQGKHENSRWCREILVEDYNVYLPYTAAITLAAPLPPNRLSSSQWPVWNPPKSFIETTWDQQLADLLGPVTPIYIVE